MSQRALSSMSRSGPERIWVLAPRVQRSASTATAILLAPNLRPLLIDFGLDELGELAERFLPAEVAGLDRDSVRNALLFDRELGAN